MIYLSYDEYTELGGTLDFTAFNQNIDRVCEFLDLHTQGRLQSVLEISHKVKLCVRECVEYIASNSSSGKVITRKSRTASGVSECERYAAKSTDEIKAEMLCIVYDYLISEEDDNGTPLMYSGSLFIDRFPEAED